MKSISRSAEFAEVRARGFKYRAGALSLVFLPGDEPEVRLGMSVPRKVGKAVVRNKLRRRVRAIFREQESSMAAGSYVVLAYPQSAALDYHQLSEIVTSLTVRASRAVSSASKTMSEAVEEHRV
ncbi:MAG: ribonuclease P protein component [Nitrospiraceae bacterium]|nr:ribonuclease P protein component [Nitrospiraceae bacterium]